MKNHLPQKSGRLISLNVSAMALSAIMEMEMRAAAIPDVASLALGLPSFKTPDSITRLVNWQLQEDADIGKYTLSDGLPELRESVAWFHQSRTGVSVGADRHIVITAGNMQGLNVLLHALIDPSDEIIVTDPGFASHVQQIVLCGGTPVYWKLNEAAGWELDVEGLSDLISDRTKAIILVSPSNPTGKIFTEAELRRVGEIARKHGLLVMLDDPYCHFTYENSDRYFNLSSVRELAEHTAYLYTFSKAHAMTGWRLGYMVVSEQLKHEVLKIHDATLICAPRISQIAGLAALSEYTAYLPEFHSILSKRRQLICERLDRLPHVFSYAKPEGAYYVFPRIVADHSGSCAFSRDLLQSAHVSLTLGSAFGPTGEHHVRMAYCVPADRIELAFDRLEKRFPA